MNPIHDNSNLDTPSKIPDVGKKQDIPTKKEDKDALYSDIAKKIMHYQFTRVEPKRDFHAVADPKFHYECSVVFFRSVLGMTSLDKSTELVKELESDMALIKEKAEKRINVEREMQKFQTKLFKLVDKLSYSELEKN